MNAVWLLCCCSVGFASNLWHFWNECMGFRCCCTVMNMLRRLCTISFMIKIIFSYYHFIWGCKSKHRTIHLCNHLHTRRTAIASSICVSVGECVECKQQKCILLPFFSLRSHSVELIVVGALVFLWVFCILRACCRPTNANLNHSMKIPLKIFTHRHNKRVNCNALIRLPGRPHFMCSIGIAISDHFNPFQ